jgi:uncharacterized membrane protein (UPF0136 family)
MAAQIVLWVYVVLLLAGGWVGFLKAGSRPSLIASHAFAALLVLSLTGVVRAAWFPEAVLVLLLGVFAARWRKTRKFMPSALMGLLTLGALASRLAL